MRRVRHVAFAFCILNFAFLAACSSEPQQAAPEPPSLNVTSWTDKSELYMEYPPLVTGETVRFAVHLTKMADFSALNSGRPSIEMTPAAGGAAPVGPGGPPAAAPATPPAGPPGAGTPPAGAQPPAAGGVVGVKAEGQKYRPQDGRSPTGWP